MLVGARFDELAADEEAHPWLRGVEEQGFEVSRDGLTRWRWPLQPQRCTIIEGYEWTGRKGQRTRTGDEAGPLESHEAATAKSGMAAAIAEDRRHPEAAHGMSGQSQSVRRGRERVARRRRDAHVSEQKSAARSMGLSAAAPRARASRSAVGRRLRGQGWRRGGRKGGDPVATKGTGGEGTRQHGGRWTGRGSGHPAAEGEGRRRVAAKRFNCLNISISRLIWWL